MASVGQDSEQRNEHAHDVYDAPTLEDLGVFRVNPAEWWVAATLDDAVLAAANWHELPVHELVDELAPPYRLTREAAMEHCVEVDGVAVPFLVEVSRLIYQREPFPRILARARF